MDTTYEMEDFKPSLFGRIRLYEAKRELEWQLEALNIDLALTWRFLHEAKERYMQERENAVRYDYDRYFRHNCDTGYCAEPEPDYYLAEVQRLERELNGIHRRIITTIMESRRGAV